MARLWGTLGQVAPAATTLTDAYTVPALKHAVASIIIANASGGAATVRLAHAIGGAANATKQYMLYDFPLAAAESTSTAKITLKATDVVRVYASVANVAFSINGIEEDD